MNPWATHPQNETPRQRPATEVKVGKYCRWSHKKCQPNITSEGLAPRLASAMPNIRGLIGSQRAWSEPGDALGLYGGGGDHSVKRENSVIAVFRVVLYEVVLHMRNIIQPMLALFSVPACKPGLHAFATLGTTHVNRRDDPVDAQRAAEHGQLPE